ncbi:MAG: hypothetical protein KBS83_08560 [Lachnospiraceae bacterium]|nr:hypothetical protein [Candidatus Equihabitans merdae]
MKRIRVVKVILLVLSVFMLIVSGIAIAAGVSEIIDGYHRYAPDARDYSRMVEYERYGELYTDTIDDSEMGKSYSSDVKACRGLGNYYGNAVVAGAYEKMGEQDRADQYAAQAAKYADDASQYSDNINSINEQIRDALAD